MLSRPPSLFGASSLLFSASLAGLLALTSCDDDSPVIVEDLSPLAGTWNGSYTTDEAPLVPGGLIMLELAENGSGGVEGRVVVIPDDSDVGAFVFLTTAGRSGDTFHLTSNQGMASLRLDASLEGTTLSGNLAVFSDTADGAFSVEQLPEGDATITPFLSLPASHVRSLAFENATLWISTLGEDFILATPTGTPVDTVALFYANDIHWTSDVLAFDGLKLWGHLPSAATGRPTWSRLYPFTPAGIEGDGLITPHLSSGLAFDGNDLWSLHGASEKLYKVDRTTAAAIDSVHLDMPDLIHLDYFAGHFWGMGWFTQKIYKIDQSGEVVAVFDISAAEGRPFPLGITNDGQSLYFSQSAGNGSIIYRMTPQTGS